MSRPRASPSGAATVAARRHRGRPALDYPPAQHVLRDLSLAIDPHRRGPGRGAHRARPLALRDGEPVPGVLTTVVDALGGHLALFAVAPDWMATGELTLHRWGTPTGTVLYDGTVVRRGRTTAGRAGDRGGRRRPGGDLDHELRHPAPAGRHAGRRPHRPRRRAGPMALVAGTAPAAPADVPGSLTGAVGFRVTPAGAEVAMTPYVRNSFGALNGGVVAGLAETAAVGPEGGVARQLSGALPPAGDRRTGGRPAPLARRGGRPRRRRGRGGRPWGRRPPLRGRHDPRRTPRLRGRADRALGTAHAGGFGGRPPAPQPADRHTRAATGGGVTSPRTF